MFFVWYAVCNPDKLLQSFKRSGSLPILWLFPNESVKKTSNSVNKPLFLLWSRWECKGLFFPVVTRQLCFVAFIFFHPTFNICFCRFLHGVIWLNFCARKLKTFLYSDIIILNSAICYSDYRKAFRPPVTTRRLFILIWHELRLLRNY